MDPLHKITLNYPINKYPQFIKEAFYQLKDSKSDQRNLNGTSKALQPQHHCIDRVAYNKQTPYFHKLP